MTGFQEPHTDLRKWDAIHIHAIKGFPHKIEVMIPDKNRNVFLGLSAFREELWVWIVHHTTIDNVQWEATYDGKFTFYFKEKDVAALFKLTYL